MASLAVRSAEREIIDGPVDALSELWGSFRDIARANRYFGGVSAAQRGLAGLGATHVLDVGTGIADIPAELCRRARLSGADLTMTCTDTNASLLDYAREKYGGDHGLQFVEADAKRLPFADGAFDVAICNLALHHFDPDDAVVMLAELRRVSRMTPVITDLMRSPLAYAATYAFAHALSRNALTRHDAPLSVRRAYTPLEAESLAREAGWRRPVARPFALIRMVVRDEAGI